MNDLRGSGAGALPQSALPAPPAGPAAEPVVEALRWLGKRNVVLAIHDPSFPSAEGEDVGRGSPYSRGGEAFVRFARRLGFDGLQLGPQGQTSRVNSSPYDATLFSRSVLSVDFHRLAEEDGWAELVDRDALARAVAENPKPGRDRVAYGHAYAAQLGLAAALHRRLLAAREAGRAAAGAVDAELAAFRARHAAWLEADALFWALEEEHGHVPWERWPDVDRTLYAPPPGGEAAAAARREELRRRHAAGLERWALAQLAWERQHRRLRRVARELGMKLFGDVQVGLSPIDAWSRQAVVLQDYRLGAPPSRTNPEGQPWNHSVLDPDQYRGPDGRPGPVVDFLHERLGKMLDEFDGLRIDHPHGVVCPWVYRADDPDPLHAVQRGARLFCSPDLPDHPGLARFAIARPAQLDRSQTRHADGWVRDLDEEQVARYAALLDAVVAESRAHGRDEHDVLCEVLSTQPYPLARVMARHGLGRFRVTQKAKLDDPGDVYRSENARPEDWIMVGNHDTPPIWALARRWQGTPEGAAQAAYLARRLVPDGDPAPLARELQADPGALVHAKLADCFASEARNVMVFFADLLGLDEPFNRPGTVDDDNWSLRATPQVEADHARRSAAGRAVSMPRVLALALRARGCRDGGLLARLDAAS